MILCHLFHAYEVYASKILPPGSFDLILINCLLWTALQQKLYC